MRMTPSTATEPSEVSDGSGMALGLCRCGCGHPAPIAKRTNTRQGCVKGQPQRYIVGHNRRRTPEPYRVEDRGYKTPCWVWQRFSNDDGYGLLGRYGKTYAAHRWYYEQHVGPIPPSYQVDHLCTNPSCVRPDHLEAVPHSENLRRAHGKLTVEQREEIITSSESARALARRFGVSHMTVLSVRKRHALDREQGRRFLASPEKPLGVA